MTGREDDGAITVLVVGFTVVLLLLVGVVVNVSVLVLAKRSMASAADGAAVSAAQALDYPAFYSGGLGGAVPLSEAGVDERLAAYEGQVGADLPGLQLTGYVDGPDTVVVTARRAVPLPFGGWLGAGPLQVTAQARARAPVTP